MTATSKTKATTQGAQAAQSAASTAAALEFEVVVGLEVHAQLSTRSKLFCGCKQAFGAGPNQQTCEVCLGMPGSLPSVNEEAVRLAVRAALAFGCTVHERSVWARKNYFYPDLPKGYQITQDLQPVATGGHLEFDSDGSPHHVRLTRIHIEEDAGKNVHDDALAGTRSWVDFNRGGTPLIEIVSEPDLRSSLAAADYLRTLRQRLRYLEVCDGNMEEGSLRCDANVSLRPQGRAEYGTRVELKNINSFRFVQQAIEFEVVRQAELLRAGKPVQQQTRLWDAQAKESRSMRSKENATDYRYFPDPDLPPLVLSVGYLEHARSTLPELPEAKAKRFVSELGLSEYDARILTEERDVASFFEEGVAHAGGNAKAVANWVMGEVLRARKVQPHLAIEGHHIGELVKFIDEGVISGKMAKDVFADMEKTGQAPADIVRERGLSQQSDVGLIEAWAREAANAHPEVVEKVKAGKRNGVGFLVGQVLQKSGGRANPKLVQQALLRVLGLAP